MKEKRFDFQIIYRGKPYHFNSGQEALLFQKGIEYDVQKKYGMKGLREYVSLTYECYKAYYDQYPPIEHLGWFIAYHFSAFRTMDSEDILNDFYEYISDMDSVAFDYGG